MNITEAVGNEVFLVCADPLVSSSSRVRVFSKSEELKKFLNDKKAGTNDYKVLHGVLTPARVIPRNFRKQGIFIIFTDPKDTAYGTLAISDATDSAEDLATEIETSLRSDEFAAFDPTIDSTYILYGYELEVSLTIDEEEIDDEAICTCLDILKDVETLKEMEDKDE